jgi:hypothetical protein
MDSEAELVFPSSCFFANSGSGDSSSSKFRSSNFKVVPMSILQQLRDLSVCSVMMMYNSLVQ